MLVSVVELGEGDAEGLEGVDGRAIVQMEPIFAHLQEYMVHTVYGIKAITGVGRFHRYVHIIIESIHNSMIAKRMGSWGFYLRTTDNRQA